MFSLGFGRKKAPLLGLDIGSTAVKLIELSQARAGSAHTYQVESCALEPLPPGAIAERKIADPQLVGEAIRKAVARSGSRAKAAAVAVPGSAAITKIITLPEGLSDEEMENQIKMDADQYVPYPLDEVDLDFTLLGPAVHAGEVDILLAAARHEIAINLIIALEIAGLKASIIDVEPYALENACILALGAQGEDQTTAIADIGANAMRVQVMRQGRTLFAREQGFAAAQLFEEVEHRYDLTPEEARRRVIEEDLPETYAAEVRDPFAAALAQQIGRVLQFFYSATSSKPADQVLLAGGMAGLPGLEQVVADSLGITTFVANPFLHMTLGPKVGAQLLQRQGPALALAVGLALRRFD